MNWISAICCLTDECLMQPSVPRCTVLQPSSYPVIRPTRGSEIPTFPSLAAFDTIREDLEVSEKTFFHGVDVLQRDSEVQWSEGLSIFQTL